VSDPKSGTPRCGTPRERAHAFIHRAFDDCAFDEFTDRHSASCDALAAEFEAVFLSGVQTHLENKAVLRKEAAAAAYERGRRELAEEFHADDCASAGDDGEHTFACERISALARKEGE
jgi:hypothetical protein